MDKKKYVRPTTKTTQIEAQQCMLGSLGVHDKPGSGIQLAKKNNVRIIIEEMDGEGGLPHISGPWDD